MTKKSTKTRGSATRKVAAKRKPGRKPAPTADFNEETDVLREAAKTLGFKPFECRIKRGASPNGYGDAYMLTCGQREYFVMESSDEFEAAAVEGVENDLDKNPELFDRNFIQSHVNIERLRRDLHGDVYNSNYDDFLEEANQQPMRFLKKHDIDIPSPSEKQMRDHAEAMSDDDKSASVIYDELIAEDEESRWITMGEDPEVPDSEVESVAEAQTEEQLRDPIDYLEDIYGPQEAVAQAIKIGGIDARAAAEEAVHLDGPEHFMCGYDNNYQTTRSGFIVWRHS